MTDNPFAQPAPLSETGDRFTASNHEGRIVLFAGHTQEEQETDWGVKKVARVDVVIVLDTPEGPAPYTDSLIFGAVLAPAIYNANKPVVIGRIAKGESKKGNAPWILEPLTDTEQQAAITWWGKGHITETSGRYQYNPDQAPF